MAIVGTILHEVIKKKKSNLEKRVLNIDIQQETLHKLLHKARNTEFGQNFKEVKNFAYKLFRRFLAPLFN